jgi:hypothetical protein
VIAPYAASALWGLALLASFVGWGRLAALALGRREQAHVGLALVWGFAAVLALGGWLCWLGLAERNLLAALVAVGGIGLLVERPRVQVRWSLPGALVASACALLLALTYATGCLDPRYQPGDDFVAYLRQSYGLACALVVLFEHASRFRAARDPRQGGELLCAAGSALLCVGGWALLQQQSAGTAFFPLLRGFSNPEWGVLSAGSFGEFAAAARKFASGPTLAAPLALCGLALFVPRRSSGESSLRPLAIAALVASVAHAWLLAHAQPSDLARYTSAFVLPPILFASVAAAEAIGGVRSTDALRDWRPWVSAGFLLALLWQLPPWARLGERVRVLRTEWRLSARQPGDARAVALSEQLQRTAPAGEKLLALLEQPYQLDLRRNAVASLDLPGGASPPPGLHTLGSSQQVVEYFRSLGYDLLAAVRPERSELLYRLGTWRMHADGILMSWHSDPGDVAAWQVMGRTVVRFFRQLEALTTHCRLAYDDGVRVMIDLSQCHFEDPQALQVPQPDVGAAPVEQRQLIDHGGPALARSHDADPVHRSSVARASGSRAREPGPGDQRQPDRQRDPDLDARTALRRTHARPGVAVSTARPQGAAACL